uniref:Peptidase S1 domain-containing protein n=1 Tax=Panagrolaimus sp. ES5 TaxID=591445 RepID=A0AC34G4K0_9BILA
MDMKAYYLKLFFIFVVSGVVCIHRGEWAPKHPYNFAVQLFFNNGTFLCGGSIGSEDQILSALHCVENLDKYDFFIRVGGYELGAGRIYYVDDILPHPDIRYDACIINLTTKIKFDDKEHPSQIIGIPSMATPLPSTFLFIGWGRVGEKQPPAPFLKMISLPRVPFERCQRFSFPPSCLCAGFDIPADGQGAPCEADSGGALFTENPFLLWKAKFKGILSITSEKKDCDKSGIVNGGISTTQPLVSRWLRQKLHKPHVPQIFE